MRTNVTLDSNLIKKLQLVTDTETKAKAVVIAIEDFLRRQKIKDIKNFKGKLRFRSDTAKSRHDVR
ncbi:MAG: hypothetical protein A3G32_06430 [Deltaproteobacteria bacterium RIFCSPLOWO2_12_FULL_40_28]|nr:MAG: hypothetical protein A3C45_02525 [Deltaproteobacteria bacterium RIFCSPHIGHO2_02_FULL_40_28]OGQ19086.1 MAG: hypothetical protein A3E27_05615 [Deltaproteobacteria bacterium RIFCSPHIGHO2_12_FULL_40_32]OGQ40258.1 MAG: hypothetical protein A3I69_01055 [Deltaproteobacteria bacterium RIFCSPLOWO2_02_FULL_40_36]OGQ53529.1 MAG: hypothetical protein A3G32_06430 [Deltaproteobacteria bacterium RIFCSPLOWO2_12_FULL_40_28]